MPSKRTFCLAARGGAEYLLLVSHIHTSDEVGNRGRSWSDFSLYTYSRREN